MQGMKELVQLLERYKLQTGRARSSAREPQRAAQPWVFPGFADLAICTLGSLSSRDVPDSSSSDWPPSRHQASRRDAVGRVCVGRHAAHS
jgi:hypothetical protein